MISLPEIQDRLEKLPNERQKVGEKLAIAKAKCNFMKEMRKTILAQETIKVMHVMKKTEQIKPSMAKAETMALDSEAYRFHLVAIREAEEEFGKLNVEYDARGGDFDAARSLISLEKSLAKTV